MRSVDRPLELEIGVLDVAEQDERLGTPASVRPRQEVQSERTSTARIGCLEVGAGRRDRAAVPILERIGRRQAERVLGQLGRLADRGATAGELRDLLQRRRDGFVRCARSEREVPGALDRIVDDRGQASMGSLPLFLACPLVENRREQRVREADHCVRVLDHVRRERRLERVRARFQRR